MCLCLWGDTDEVVIKSRDTKTQGSFLGLKGTFANTLSTVYIMLWTS